MSENFQKISLEEAPRTELHDKLGLTGAEVSVNRLPAGAAVPFVHAHKQNEELYGVLEGRGELWIDGEVVEVKATEGGDPELFQHLVSVRGGGRMEFPLISDITPGRYTVSLRVWNEGHSSIIKDVFTFIVE